MRSSKLRRLLVVSHVVHYRHDGRLHAYGPYSREIDIWADLFPEVVIAAPCRQQAPPRDCLPFGRSNITIRAQQETGGTGAKAKLHQLMMLPQLIGTLGAAMWQADAIHVRCPGNLGLLGAAIAPIFSRYRVAKYAGQWNGYQGEPATVGLQRALLASTWWGSPVTVYGDWPNQPTHIVPFFTSMMTAEQQRHAAQIAAARSEKSAGSDGNRKAPLRVLFSGSLAQRKRVDALLDAVKLSIDRGVGLDVVVVGDGPERAALRRQVAELGIERVVTFVGALPFDQSLSWYEWGDCLVLPSQHSEGWPKVVAEAMSYGLVCLAVAHGQVPAMLEQRGLLLSTGSAEEIAAALERVWREPAAFNRLRANAASWAGQYSLEGLRSALADLLADRWGLAPESLGATHQRLEVRP